MEEFDFIIVGGGSAGCALASRLSENVETRVLLIEAGGNGRGWKVDMPAGVVFLLGNEQADWRYIADPDPTLDDRVLSWPAGKMLGGGSAINGQVYIRGTRADFDRWAAMGCTGWGFDDVLPYFRKAEHYEGQEPRPSLGRNGLLSVSSPRHTHPLLKVFLSAFGELGYPILDDYCNGDQFGAFRALASHRNGQRCSASKAYLEPVRHRANLKIMTETFVRRLLIENGRAKGIEISRDGAVQSVATRREVIVSAGAIGSPALLLRSGIGPGEDLRGIGLPVVHDLPGVGHNLREHPSALVSRFVNLPTYNSQTTFLHQLSFGFQYLASRSGPLATLAGQGLAFAKTRDGLAEPDVQYHFSPAIYDFDSTGRAIMESRPGVAICANVCHPQSTGRIKLTSAAPESRPAIEHRAFGDSADLDTLVAGCKLADRLFATKAFEPFILDRFQPPQTPRTDADWVSFLRKKALFAYHPVGTCRMGADKEAVVDPTLKVKGIQGLRVADASIMPTLISANTNAASIMIGEKAADLIRHERLV